ncbi:MAG TPA: SUF system Fe-S cluster assembly protein [Rhizobiales bacterium]|nr:SUF system Fe-S cluster assembly protein [Hyphomicrobiales bacterium]
MNENRDTIDVSEDTQSGDIPAGTPPAPSLEKDQVDELAKRIIAAVKTVYDPEIPVDIYELGLIYKIDIQDGGKVEIEMTLTAPGCPVAGDMIMWVDQAVRGVEGVKDVNVSLVFDPPWDMSRMSDEARVQLNLI